MHNEQSSRYIKLLLRILWISRVSGEIKKSKFIIYQLLMASTVALGAPFSAYAREKLLDNSAVRETNRYVLGKLGTQKVHKSRDINGEKEKKIMLR